MSATFGLFAMDAIVFAPTKGIRGQGRNYSELRRLIPNNYDPDSEFHKEKPRRSGGRGSRIWRPRDEAAHWEGAGRGHSTPAMLHSMRERLVRPPSAGPRRR